MVPSAQRAASAAALLLALAAAEPSDSEPEQPLEGAPVPFRGERRFRSFGSTRYRQTKMTTWQEVLEKTTGIGAKCDMQKPREQCGTRLVCRNGVCQYCQGVAGMNECAVGYHCDLRLDGENTCVEQKEEIWVTVMRDPSQLPGMLMILLAAMLAAAAGVGGGGIFVPLLTLCTPLNLSETVPMAQAMILSGAVINVMFFIHQRHALFRDLPKIDYDCVVLLEPMLCAGVTWGVLLHQASPAWFLVGLLCLTIGPAFWRTAMKGIQQFRQESEEDPVSHSPSASETRALPLWRRFVRRFNTFMELMGDNARAVIGVVVIWFLVFLSTMHPFSKCSHLFFAFLAGCFLVLVFITWIAVSYVVQEHAARTPAPRKSGETALQWTGPCISKYPAMAFGAGFLGGLLGLGGGIILSPVLLELGMHPESVQATTSIFVFLSSSLAVVQYSMLNVYTWHLVVWFCSISVVGTLIGQLICELYVRRHRRFSVITFAIACILFVSMVALLILGIMSVIASYPNNMGFSFWKLCASVDQGETGILAPGATKPRDKLLDFFF